MTSLDLFIILIQSIRELAVALWYLVVVGALGVVAILLSALLGRKAGRVRARKP